MIFFILFILENCTFGFANYNKHTCYLIYFQMIAVGCTDHDVICIFHDLVCTDHAVVYRIIQHANKNSYATG